MNPAPGPTAGASSAADVRAAVVERSSALVAVFDAAGHCVLANPALTRTLGWSEAELRAAPFWDLLVVPEDREPARDCLLRAVREGEAFPQEGDWLARGGRRHRISMQTDALRDERGRPWAMVVVGVDVSEARRAQALVQQRATTDELTGLLNRGAFYEALTRVLGEPDRSDGAGAGSGCGVLYCDLDGFKAVNDTHGHRVGDLLLQEVARRLREQVGPEDLVARLGGDEFVVVTRPAPGAGLTGEQRDEELARLAERIRRAVQRPVETVAGLITVDVSIGCVLAGPRARPDDVVHSADQRMYGVKTTRRPTRGRGSWRWERRAGGRAR